MTISKLSNIERSFLQVMFRYDGVQRSDQRVSKGGLPCPLDWRNIASKQGTQKKTARPELPQSFRQATRR